jgi:hypothetical protein
VRAKSRGESRKPLASFIDGQPVLRKVGSIALVQQDGGEPNYDNLDRGLSNCSTHCFSGSYRCDEPQE